MPQELKLALLTSAGGPCQRAPPESSLQPSTGLCCGEGRLGPPWRSCLGSCAYVLKPVPMPSSPAFCAHAERLSACSVRPLRVVTMSFQRLCCAAKRARLLFLAQPQSPSSRCMCGAGQDSTPLLGRCPCLPGVTVRVHPTDPKGELYTFQQHRLNTQATAFETAHLYVSHCLAQLERLYRKAQCSACCQQLAKQQQRV